MTSVAVSPSPPPTPGDWADPDFYAKRLGRGGRLWQLVWMVLLPPEGQRTMPTSAGYVLILVTLGLLSAAYSTSSNILFMALSLLISSLILSIFLSLLNFKSTRWRLLHPPHFRADDPAMLQIELNNAKKLIPSYSLCFKVNTQSTPSHQRIHLQERLDPGKTLHLEWSFTPTKRGTETLGITGLESQFPFGFLRKSISGGIHQQVIVLPRRIEYSFDPAGFHHSHIQGETNRRPGTGNELINIRRYQRGDPQRLVHWKASARQRQLVVRQMAEENRDGFILFVESPSSLWPDKEAFETLCAFAASLAEDLFRDGSLLATAINDEPLRPVKRLHDLQTFLEQLALLETTSTYSPAPETGGRNLITFRPGVGGEVNALLGGNLAGTAQR